MIDQIEFLRALVLFSFLTNLGLVRNSWVFRERTLVILEDVAHRRSYVESGTARLASYSEMFWKFWIWDVEKFKR